MKSNTKLSDADLAAIKQRRAEFDAICAVEGIHFTAEDEELFAMFDRERWPHERRLEFLKAGARKAAAQ